MSKSNINVNKIILNDFFNSLNKDGNISFVDVPVNLGQKNFEKCIKKKFKNHCLKTGLKPTGLTSNDKNTLKSFADKKYKIAKKINHAKKLKREKKRRHDLLVRKQQSTFKFPVKLTGSITNLKKALKKHSRLNLSLFQSKKHKNRIYLVLITSKPLRDHQARIKFIKFLENYFKITVAKGIRVPKLRTMKAKASNYKRIFFNKAKTTDADAADRSKEPPYSDKLESYFNFLYLGGYKCLREVGVGCPRLKTNQDLVTADVILRLYHREAGYICDIKKLQKKESLGTIYYGFSGHHKINVTVSSLNDDYFEIKKASVKYRLYSKLWLQNHSVTVKQFKNLALMFGNLIPQYSKVKGIDLNSRLSNFLSLLTVDYARATATSFRQVIYNPFKNENQGQYIKNDNVAKMLLRILNPDLGSYQIKELFDRLVSFLPIKCKKFHQHPSDPNIIAYRNGLLYRPSRKFRPINAKDKIIPKLDTNLNPKYVKLVPTQKLIKKYGFKGLVIKLATDYHSKNKKWHQLEYPFSQMNYLNKQIQKFNPYRYIYFLANKDTTRTVTLFQVLLSNLQTNYAHDSMMLLNSTGKRGKSTFLDIVQNIVGKAAVSHVSLQDLGDTNKPFAASSMLGSVATVNNETTSSGFLKDDSTLKQLVSHEEMDVPEKYQNPIRTSFPFMAYTGATNNGLKIHGDTKADSRRVTMIQFKNNWITKYGTSDFRKIVINSRPVTLWFAAFVGLCVPNFTKFTVCLEDVMAKQKQTTGTNTVFTFIKKELVPQLRKNRRDYVLRPTMSSPLRTRILTNIPKVIVFDWYVNYTRQTGGKAVGSTKFIKQFRQGLSMSSLVPSNTMKLAQRTVTKSDAIGYTKLAKDDKYMPTTQGRKLKTDDFGKAVGKRKRCLCISYNKPLFSGSPKDKELAKPLKKQSEATDLDNNFLYVGLKDNKNTPTLGVFNIQNGLAEVVGNLEINHRFYYAEGLWIRVSKLNLKGGFGDAFSIGKNILRKDSQKLIKNFRKQFIKNIFDDNEDPIKCKLDLKSAYHAAKHHDDYDARITDFKELFMRLYLTSNKQLLANLFNLKFKSEIDSQCVPRISHKMKVRYQRQKDLDCKNRN